MDTTHKEHVIFMLSVARWDQDLSSASLSIAKELSKQCKVFYIDHPYTIKDVLTSFRSPTIKRRMRALLTETNIYSRVEPGNENLTAITPVLTLPINWLPPGKVYNFFSRLNNRLFFRSIRKAIRDHRLTNYIYWNSYNPFFSFEFPRDITPSLVIYQSRDNIERSNYVKKHGPQLERKAAGLAHLRMATSLELTRKLSIPGKEFIFFPNAANVAIFKQARNRTEKPKDIEHLTCRIIGYTGNICLRQDYELLYKIATAFPDCALVLVGPRNDHKYHTFDFDSMPNVIFAGPKKLDELPAYLAHMDVTIIPFLKNDLTKSIYPLKLNEYLAAGKPVISTDFSPDIRQFSDVVYISKDHDEFISNIQKALQEDTPDKASERIRVAEENSWEGRTRQFWQLLHSKNLANQ